LRRTGSSAQTWDINIPSGSTSLRFGAANGAGMTLDGNGNLAVGGTLSATIITGTTVIGAVYQDVAESVPATDHLAPGPAAVLNPERANVVMPSSRAYDTSVAGVVSEKPGVILGVGSADKEKIATTGRVRVKVDATHAAIGIGDLLVTSDERGV